MTYYLGIVGGGVTTISYLANHKGEVVGRGEAGACLHYSKNGLENAISELKKAADRAVLSSGREIEEVETACFGLAGIDSTADYDRVYPVLVKEGIARNIVLENDAVTALIGGNIQPYGVVLISDIGSISFGINKKGERKRANGWGHRVGDEGSAYDIGVAAIKAAFKAYDGREEATLLVPLFQEHLEISSMADIMTKIHFRLDRIGIAALSELVFKAVEEGDRVAQRILIRAGDELGRSINAVITGLGMASEMINIPLVGRVFENKGRQLLVDVIKEKVLYVAPKAEIVDPHFEPGIGAVIKALARSGIEINEEVIGNLKRTVREL